MADYIFGYGSLMSRESRTATDKGALGAWPATVKGYLRGWFHKFSNSNSISPTFLGVVAMDEQSANGIIYKTDDIKATDQRENGYTREEVDKTKIQWRGPSLKLTDLDKVWIYVSDKDYRDNAGPEEGNPIAQSYVDICITGCFEADEIANTLQTSPGFDSPFANEFIKLTSHWGYWVNDRTTPRRPWVHQPNAGRIDSILKANIPEVYNNIKADSMKQGKTKEEFDPNISL